MPIVDFPPDLRGLPSWITLDMLADAADQGVIGRGPDGAGPFTLLSPSANGQIFKRSGDVVGFSALDATDWAPLLASANTWSLLQTALAGVRLNPGSALASPSEGTMWYESTGGRLMYRDATGSVPIIEIGTWTPSLRADTVGSSNIVYSSQVGTYVKMGRRLWIDFNIVTTTFDLTGASGTMRILGLPYTMSTLASQIAGFVIPLQGLSLATTAGLQQPFIFPVVNTTQLVFRRVVTGSNTTTGSLAVGSTNGFLSNQQVTLQGSGYIGRTNEA